jgi:hypothetical protein
VYPENALKIRMTRYRGQKHVELPARKRHSGRDKEIEQHYEHCDDRRVLRHLICLSATA